ncbi:MAG: hypothetical protein KTR32_36695 [Granulosicoccus sp.]|nr:hypothetical protein [Granulosicoccus sp.]
MCRSHALKRCAQLLVTIAVIVFTASASANLCRDSNISVRDAQEAAHLATLNFSNGDFAGNEEGDFAGNEEYDALVIGCNRKRDSRGKMIEESFEPSDTFPANLPPRLIKGTLNYYGKFPVRYGYELARENGEWIVTLPVKFDFDTPNHPHTLDISIETARENGLVVPGGACDDSDRNNVKPNQVKENGFILRGVLGGHIGDDSCRLPKTTRIDGVPIQDLVADYWLRSIRDFWTRPGVFRVNAVNYDDLSPSEQDRYLSAKAYWKVEFNSRPSSRALYSPVFTKPTPLYSGEAAFVIAHEVGHALGLDDEYKGKGEGRAWRHCEDRSDPDQHYAMCEMPLPPTTNNILGPLSDTYSYAKGVYYWLITRRYEAETCKTNDDCGSAEYCATGAIKNHCEALKRDGDNCSADKQCGQGLSCVNKPAGMCVFENSVAMNGKCSVNEQCTTGRCQGTGSNRMCVCNDDPDCPDGSYCRNRAGQNECRLLHTEYSSCTSDSQCQDGFTCNNKPLGHCISTTLKSINARCEYNNECRTGKCQGKGDESRCVCDDNNDCDDGEYCNKRLGANRCLVDAALAIGQSCSKNAECSTNKCENKECVCRNNNDCPGSQKCKTPVAKKNYCE